MKKSTPIKYTKAIIAVTTTLLIFLIGINAILVLQERKRQTKEYTTRARNNLTLIGTMISEPLLKQDFTIIEQFILQWGKKDKNTLSLRTLSPKGLIIAEFKRTYPKSKKTAKFSHSVYYLNNHLADLKIVKDISPTESHIKQFWTHLMLQSFVISIALGFVLWFILKKLALRPMETEITRRKQAEDNLQKAHDLLETRIKKRTAKLRTAATSLNEEIEERMKTEHALKKARDYIDNIINSMPSVLIGTDANGNVTQWNKKAEQTTGITAKDAHGKPLSCLLPYMSSELKSLLESIQSRKIKRQQKKPRLFNNNRYYEDITIFPLIANGVDGVVIRIDDVTEKVRMEEMMVQSEKMLSVGGLAAGMAHEINNPLAGMIQTADVLANRLGKKINLPANLLAAEKAGTTIEAIHNFMKARGIPEMIKTINESGMRIATIVKNMLSFSIKSEGQKSLHTLAELLDNTLKLAATDYDLKKHYDFKLIKIIKEYANNLPPTPCESAKIQQVLLNILRNGAQAMQRAETEEPTFTIRTYFEKKRKMSRIEIEDNGPGMDEEIRKRVFEPFYTTKPVGEGTGLGLSVSYFIITENHNGEMTVESSPGAGTKFIILLPTK